MLEMPKNTLCSLYMDSLIVKDVGTVYQDRALIYKLPGEPKDMASKDYEIRDSDYSSFGAKFRLRLFDWLV